MFSGIVEEAAEIVALQSDKDNLHISVKSKLTSELKIDQSVAHNGVCLTVVDINDDVYTVTAIKETLQKSNLADLKIGSKVNLERSLVMNGRLDGHIVQGHVDQVAECVGIEDQQGSWFYTFKYNALDPKKGMVTVEKGSVCVNGCSLTVVNSKADQFSVAIIPYTHEFTNFHQLKLGSKVNLEFDILGKYIAKMFPENN